MDYTTLGDTGLKVSRIALGLAFRGQLDSHEMERTVRRALDFGINFFDCANDYGRTPDSPYGKTAELALGRAIKDCRDDLVITSKVYWDTGPNPNDSGGSRYHIMREIDRTLERLGTDHLDVYLLHDRDRLMALEETVECMCDLVRQGKTRYWGICNFKAWEAAHALGISARHGGPKYACIQNPYSLLNRCLETEMLPFCRENRRGVMAFSPLAIGLLTGAYSSSSPPPPGSPWGTDRRSQYMSVMAGPSGQLIETVCSIAAEYNRPPSHIAIRWVLSNPAISTAIVGCDTVEQVETNMTALDFNLSQDHIDRLSNISASIIHPVT